MAYLLTRLTGADARLAATDSPPTGPGLPEEQVLNIDALEVWGSSIKDEGDDWTEFRAFKGSETLGVWRVSGY